jgi:hypothetical protein
VRSRAARPYASAYVAGVGLGLVLLAAFVLAGRGLGASGAFASVAAATVRAVSPSTAASNPYFERYLANSASPWRDWLVFELAGAVIGAWISARLAGRIAIVVEGGRGVGRLTRLGLASSGGLAMGAGAVLARGCTSGQALSGGAVLSVGSWLFIVAAFAAAYAAAPALRRVWR